MKLYLLSQEDRDGYDTYDALVVAAESEESARLIHPYSRDGFKNDRGGRSGVWARSPEKVDVRYLGEASEGTETGIILASFNAG